MRGTSAALFALLLVVTVDSASAQAAEAVPRGARVRVTPVTPSRAVVGELIAVSDSALVVRSRRGRGDVTIPRTDVLRLEVSRGTSRGRSAGWGALLGLAIGGGVGFASGNDSCGGDSWFCLDRPTASLVGGITGVATGSFVGLVVGSFERWRDTAVPMSLSVMPSGGQSLSVGGRIAF